MQVRFPSWVAVFERAKGGGELRTFSWEQLNSTVLYSLIHYISTYASELKFSNLFLSMRANAFFEFSLSKVS